MNKKKALKLFSESLGIVGDSKFTEHIDSISSLIDKRRREIVFLEYQEGVNLYCLLSGSIKLYKTSSEGKEAVIRFVEPGEFFAEIVLFLKNRYPVSAIAIKDSQLLSINSKKMFEIIKENPEFAMKFIGIFAHRLNYMTEIIRNLSLMGAKEKFLNYLYTVKDDNNIVKLNIPKQEIALLLGIKPETFSRVLKQLSKEGALKADGKNIKILI